MKRRKIKKGKEISFHSREAPSCGNAFSVLFCFLICGNHHQILMVDLVLKSVDLQSSIWMTLKQRLTPCHLFIWVNMEKVSFILVILLFQEK